MGKFSERIYYEDSEINKLFTDILFLKRKINNLKSKIEESHDKFVEYCVEYSKKNIKSKLKSIKKDNSMELKLTEAFISSEADNDLFFQLDTFFIDVKRLVEFTFRFIAKCEGLKQIRFSLENLLNQLPQNTRDNRSKLSKILIEKYPEYTSFILSKKKWFNSLNYKRTQLIHYEIFNKTDGFKIEFFWNSVMSLEDEPQIKSPIFSMFKKPIKELVKEDLSNLDEFLNKSLELRKDLIKKIEVI